MDPFHKRLIERAATFDERLSDMFEPLPGEKDDAEIAAQRLAAWCRASAGGDWSLFARRLERDHLSMTEILPRFATIRRRPGAPLPAWIEDAIWIEAALQSADSAPGPLAEEDHISRYPFDELFAPVIAQAEAQLSLHTRCRPTGRLCPSARDDLRSLLLRSLCGMAAPPLYERFDKARKAGSPPGDAIAASAAPGTSRYRQFIAEMRAGGLRRLFDDKPVLLRLLATATRQWIDSTGEFLLRLDADLPRISRDLLGAEDPGAVAAIEGDISDPHNDGRAVLILRFEDGARIVYKPKDLRLDVAWHALVARLNHADAPVELRAALTVACDGYGWTEFVAHQDCDDAGGPARFFRRAGAWLALFHVFAANDMHQENIIAGKDHPVPIDLETLLQAEPEQHHDDDAEAAASEAAKAIIANSVMMVGLLPAYGLSAENKVFAIGGLNGDWNAKTKITWHDINTDAMRPAKIHEAAASIPNLPRVDGRYAAFADHVEALVAGFADYARFLLHERERDPAGLFEGFAGVCVRRIVRPTRFYDMLLHRLRNHRTMSDGVIWSAQADFIARLSEWDDEDPLWPLQRAERSALLAMNIPYFAAASDDNDIRDKSGAAVSSKPAPGLDRARSRLRELDDNEISFQVEIIRENTRSGSSPSVALEPSAPSPPLSLVGPLTIDRSIAEADRLAAEMAACAIRRGASAAWIGLDWLGDAEVFQLVCLGPDLYNGATGIAVFLAAHAKVTGNAASAELARCAVASLRKNLKSRSAARFARSLGCGGAVGLGSIVYALTVMAQCLDDHTLRADAEVAAALITDELIASDTQLDVISGSAGAILGLLRLYRDTGSGDILDRAVRCGEHILSAKRQGADGRRSWIGQGLGTQPLNGMSHGAAGFAFALASLADATGRDEFTAAAAECIAFEDTSYEPARHNWPDLRGEGESLWPCQWCHGATGIGLARLAMTKLGNTEKLVANDVAHALGGTERSWPGELDTLCCGTLGGIEFLCEAGDALRRDDLAELGAQRLQAVLNRAAATGDFRWNNGKRRFNLGLFRGLSGVGYTLLRRVDRSLPNVLIWE